MRNKQIKDMVFASIIIAMMVAMTLLGVAFLPLTLLGIPNPVWVSIVHIPVIIGAIILGPRYGMILGLVYGLSSLYIASITMGFNAPFTNPLLSVVPRMVFGWAIYYVHQFFTKLIKSRSLAVSLTMVSIWLVNGIIITTILYFVATTGFYFNANDNPWTGDTYATMFIAIFSINVVVEIIGTALIATPIVLVMDKLIRE